MDVFLISSFHRLSVQVGWSTLKAAEEWEGMGVQEKSPLPGGVGKPLFWGVLVHARNGQGASVAREAE